MSAALVTVWADGYGRWHTETAVSDSALQDSINAMADAIMERAPRGTSRKTITDKINDGIVHAEAVFDRLINQARINGTDY